MLSLQPKRLLLSDGRLAAPFGMTLAWPPVGTNLAFVIVSFACTFAHRCYPMGSVYPDVHMTHRLSFALHRRTFGFLCYPMSRLPTLARCLLRTGARSA